MLGRVVRAVHVRAATRRSLSSAARSARRPARFWHRCAYFTARWCSVVVDNPYTGETFCRVPALTETQANQRIAAASRAFQEWRTADMAKRVEVCLRFCDAFEASAERVAREISGQMGKPLKQAQGEVATCLNRARTMIRLAPEALRERVLAEPAGSTLYRKIAFEPIGPVLVVAPWNYPLLCAVNVVVPAVLAGNSVLLKHSNRTPLCADHFADAFRAAGALPELVQTLQGSHELVAKV